MEEYLKNNPGIEKEKRTEKVKEKLAGARGTKRYGTCMSIVWLYRKEEAMKEFVAEARKGLPNRTR